MSPVTLAIKVDVCTHAGLQHGVPALMRLFDEIGVRASFFIAGGPDHSGRAIRRIFRPGFLEKMRRTSAVGTYGLKTVLYGTLLPGPPIAGSFPDCVRQLHRDGHEVGIHGYDHVYWQDQLPRLSLSEVATEVQRAATTFADILGEQPRAFGAPGWQCTANSFAAEDGLGLLYHSDTRGFAPFRPAVGAQVFQTIEIPTTMLTLDETFGRYGTSETELAAYYTAQLRPGLNVYTAHAEMEGRNQLGIFRYWLQSLKGQVRFSRLVDVAGELQDVPVAQVADAPIEGRHGTVCWQARPSA